MNVLILTGPAFYLHYNNYKTGADSFIASLFLKLMENKSATGITPYLVVSKGTEFPVYSDNVLFYDRDPAEKVKNEAKKSGEYQEVINSRTSTGKPRFFRVRIPFDKDSVEKYIKEYKIDAIINNNTESKLLNNWLNSLGIPVFTIIHNVVSGLTSFGSICENLNKIKTDGNIKVISTSNFVKNFFDKYSPNTKGLIDYVCFPTLQHIPLGRLKTWNNRDNNFIFTGRVERHTRLEGLIDLLNHNNFGLTVAGAISDGQYGDEIKEKVNNSKDINLLGRLSSEDLFEQLKNHKYFIMVASDHAFSIAAYEAVKLGCRPIIIGKPEDSGLIEVVQKECFLFNDEVKGARSSNPKIYKDELLKLLEKPYDYNEAIDYLRDKEPAVVLSNFVDYIKRVVNK